MPVETHQSKRRRTSVAESSDSVTQGLSAAGSSLPPSPAARSRSSCFGAASEAAFRARLRGETPATTPAQAAATTPAQAATRNRLSARTRNAPPAALTSKRRGRNRGAVAAMAASRKYPYEDLGDCSYIFEFCGASFWDHVWKVAEIGHIGSPKTVEVRVLNKWRPYHLKPTMSYLFVDKNGGGIQGLFDESQELALDSMITLMGCYRIQGYKCIRAPSLMRVARHAAAISMDKSTTITPIADTDEIPRFCFNFIKKADLHNRVDKNDTLTGHIQLQSTSATVVHIDPNIELARSMAESFPPIEAGTPQKRVVFVEKPSGRRRRAIAALQNEESSILAKASYTIEGSITALEAGRGWYYPACPKCNKRVPLNTDGYSCIACEQTDKRYMYCITGTISDGTGSITATLFGNAVASLVGVSCYDMVHEHGHTDDSKMPDMLQSIKGLKRIFMLEKGKRDAKGLRFAINKVFEVATAADDDTPSRGSSTKKPAAKECSTSSVTAGTAATSTKRKLAFTEVYQLTQHRQPFWLSVRVIHMWEALNDPPAMTCLLLDINGDAIQAVFKGTEAVHVRHKLKKMMSYDIYRYTLIAPPPFDKVAPIDIAIQIDRNLVAVRLEDNLQLPYKYFNFMARHHLNNWPILNRQLIDYMGKITDLEEAHIEENTTVLRVTLQAPGSRPIVVSLWDNIYEDLIMPNITEVDHEVIFLATALRVVPIPGSVRLQCTAGTRLFVDPGLPEKKEMAAYYRISCVVTDHAGTIRLNLSDNNIIAMTSILCYNMISINGLAQNDVVPPPILQLIGSRWIFAVTRGHAWSETML
ncbi:hypothetical protein SSX86_023951 [Deinandra increscens subsp. villosa]|uniref:Replication factor A C-terminal domain-containing protein n=1 Tax=Deinandra increscens subsp. villosa TaxID=3103831 RepID=A0AAP0CNP7_9ASTR